MLKAIKELLVGTREVSTREKSSAPSSPTGPAGYFMPQSATQLLDMPARKQCLQQLWENSALPKDLYEQFYLQPLHHLVTLMQVLPATRQGEYANEGGLVDITLQTTTYAVRLAKGHMLPPGVAPEEQSAQNILWNAVVFYAALWRYLPQLVLIEGELQSGRPWLPGVTVPAEPYRFRFRPVSPDSTITTSQRALIACRLLPAEAVNWLSILPTAAHAVMLIASGQPSSLPVIDEIVKEAVKLAGGDAIANLAAVAIPSSPMPVPAETSPDLVGESAAQVALESSVPGVAVQSAVSGEPTAINDLEDGADTAAAVSSEGAMAVPPGDVLLSSALDAPVNDLPLAEMIVAPEPAVEVEEEMQALLSLMNVSVLEPAASDPVEKGDAPHSEVHPSEGSQQPATNISTDIDRADDPVPSLTESIAEPRPLEKPVAQPLIQPDLSHQGSEQMAISQRQHELENADDEFWKWLATGLQEQRISVNHPESRAHMVSGFVFLCVPEIFHLYIKECGKERSERNAIQKAFEKMGRHRVRKGQRFFIGHLYQEPAGCGSYRRINGYLVKANSLYGGKHVPEDSQLLVIP
ncbi:helicase/relaxase domain-containing protein [Serratia sp. AKBS12]|uniref:helicase/relaxase domain-containing protein n=1 Tax=Serratia sp. AKBS12 TaxID=2974597 RepID=UPI002165F58D|nr:helicase/relaxase domain-containing protein [Serratia sp. AKBS12]MCS3406101.1 helicase/relaxase domain-containing protein [Serratia sp. AKBS12]